MTDEDVFVYVGILRGLRVAVMVDRPEYKKSTAKELAKWIRDGLVIDRETIQVFRKKGLASSKEVDSLKAKK
jgi:hypothetical protein